MSIAQLRNRISGMEATTRQTLTAAHSNSERTAPSWPHASSAKPPKRTARAPSPRAWDPADVPAQVKCNVCPLLIGQEENGGMLANLDSRKNECPADPTYWARPRTNPRFPDQHAAPIHAPEPEPIHDTPSKAEPIARVVLH
jgi:hypothetical protein